MPTECLNSKKSHNSSTTYPNPTWNDSLERYQLSTQVLKISKKLIIVCAYSSLPKLQKTHFGQLGRLGIKDHQQQQQLGYLQRCQSFSISHCQYKHMHTKQTHSFKANYIALPQSSWSLRDSIHHCTFESHSKCLASAFALQLTRYSQLILQKFPALCLKVHFNYKSSSFLLA